jgi:L-threonylcarbamoyladenylate synthase
MLNIMQLLEANKKNIELAAEVIKQGGLVSFPTETVYGLGADGLNPIATAKIFEAKSRPKFDPLILHIAERNTLDFIAEWKNENVEKLINKFWPGPLTLVLPKKKIVPEIVTAGNPTIAVRMPDHKVALELIKLSGVPIAAPSANKFGHLSPTDAQHVVKQLKNKVDIILNGGPTTVGVESTILEVTDNEIYLLRYGGLTLEDIESVVGKVVIKQHQAAKPNSPGQLPFHYSPTLPLKFLSAATLEENRDKRIGVIFFKEKNVEHNFAVEKILSSAGDLREAAANLFSHLYELEKENIDIILIEPVAETGLGRAIMDRLKRASNKYK